MACGRTRAGLFRLGSGYLQGHYPQLHAGDFVQIVWNHLTVGVHVKYGPDGVPSPVHGGAKGKLSACTLVGS